MLQGLLCAHWPLHRGQPARNVHWLALKSLLWTLAAHWVQHKTLRQPQSTGCRVTFASPLPKQPRAQFLLWDSALELRSSLMPGKWQESFCLMTWCIQKTSLRWIPGMPWNSLDGQLLWLLSTWSTSQERQEQRGLNKARPKVPFTA